MQQELTKQKTKQKNHNFSLDDLNMAVNKCGELRFR